MRKSSLIAGIAAFLIMVCLAAVPALADDPEIAWQKALGGSGEDDAFSLQPTNDGGYVVAGDTTSTDGDISISQGMSDVWIAKLGADGEKEWVKTIGGSSDDHVTCIERLSDGTLLLSGFTWSHDGDFSDNPYNVGIWNMGIDEEGTTLWKRCYQGSNGSFAKDGKETPDGGMIMIGQSYSVPGNPDYYGGYDVLVAKTDSNANITWETLLGGSGDDFGDNILPVPGGGYIAIGFTNSNDGNVSGNHGSFDAWLFRLDEAGNLLWQKCLGGSIYDEGREIFVAPDGNYAVMGFTNSNDGDVSGNHGSLDYWWVSLAPNGTILSQKCFGGSDYDLSYDLEMTADGNYIATGVSYSSDGEVSRNAGNGDVWVVLFNKAGTILWERSFGGSDLDRGQTIKPDPLEDGVYYLAGSSASNDEDVTGNHGGLDYWVVQLSTGPVIPAGVTNLTNTTCQPGLITWTWTDPSSADFDHVLVYLDGVFMSNVTRGKETFTATGLSPGTAYTLSTRTAGNTGVISPGWVNQTARTAVTSGPGILWVASYPREATIHLDGIVRGRTNQFVFNLPAGTHNLTLTRGGYQTTTIMVDVPSGLRVLAPVTLSRDGGVQGSGTLYVASYPSGATIMIDGTVFGRTDEIVYNVPTGDRNLTLVKPGYQQKTISIQVPERDIRVLRPINLVPL